MGPERFPAFFNAKTGPARIGDLELRPLSPPTLMLLQRVGNKLLAPEELEGKDMDHPDVMGAIQEFIFIQAAPLEEVARLSRGPREQWDDAVLIFCASHVKLDDLVSAQELFDEQSSDAASRAVEPETSTTDAPDPNP